MTAPLFAGLGNPTGRAIGGHQSARSGTDIWLTPPFVIEALGGWRANDTDPAAAEGQPWRTAKVQFTERDNGLLQRWEGEVWLNPPYSRPAIERFMGRMAAHGRGIALIFARTETDMFFETVWARASALLFLHRRLNFHHADGRRAKLNSGAPTVLCAYGESATERLAFSGLDGQFVPLRLPRGVAVLALSVTWSEAVAGWLAQQDGPVVLADIYRAFARHPKAAGRAHYQAKIRQVLQRGAGRRVGRGCWGAAA